MLKLMRADSIFFIDKSRDLRYSTVVVNKWVEIIRRKPETYLAAFLKIILCLLKKEGSK